MGSQQLLLIVLGLIVVLSMIYVGTALYRDYVVNNNRDQLISTLNAIADMCQTYYKKPVEMGGGEGEFTGWQLPTQFNATDVGEFRATVREDMVILIGTGTEEGFDGRRNVIVYAVTDGNSTTIQIRN